MTTTRPEIPDTWKGGISATCRVLECDPKTLKKYTQMGARHGGIDCKISRTGRIVYYGREVKRFWDIY